MLPLFAKWLYDAATGKCSGDGYPASFTMRKRGGDQVPPKTTRVRNGRFVYRMTGVVTAWDAALAALWQKPGSTTVPMYTSHAFSPLVERGVVIFHVGGHNEGALTAYDVNSGDVKWSWRGDGPGYGSPVVADFGGTRQIVTITQGKLVSVDAASRAALERDFASPNFTNSYTHRVRSTHVYWHTPPRRSRRKQATNW